VSKCEYCGIEVELPFQCNYCGKFFCEVHRLLENHDCPNAPPRTPLGSHQTKKMYREMERAKEVKHVIEITDEESLRLLGRKAMTKTYEGKHHFDVPVEVYADKKYRQKLNNARTLNEVEHLVHDYYKHHRKESKAI